MKAKMTIIIGIFLKLLLPLVFSLAFYLVISYFFLFPRPKVRIIKQNYNMPNLVVYEIIISNTSSPKQDIYNLEFSFKFNEKYPVKNYLLKEINFKSDIMLKSSEDFEIKENGQDIKSKILTNGFRGATDKFPSDITVAIEVYVDTSYDGSRGDVFPSMLMPELRPNSYFIKYQYKPLGPFPILFTKKECFDFSGTKSRLDNLKSYNQKVILSDGKEIKIGFDIDKKHK